MKKLKKNIQKKYAKISIILEGNSKFLKYLEQKRDEGNKKIKEYRDELIIEDIFRLNRYRRNYSCSSYNYEQEPKNIHLKIYFSKFTQFPYNSKYDLKYSLDSFYNSINDNNDQNDFNNKKKCNNNFPRRLLYNKFLSKTGKQIINS